MKDFLDQNFILQTKTAEQLYHEHAKHLPVIDFHNHLPPQEIAENKQYSNISQIWLNGDHYKWRAMRANGINEKFITGDASDYEKFEKWAETVPSTIRNPLYHWTHLELQRYFDISDLLSPKSAEAIFEKTAAYFAQDDYRVQGLLQKMNVEVACTTDDPIDTLIYHKQCAKSGLETKILPTWRPDKTMKPENTSEYNTYIDKLEAVANMEIATFTQLTEALRKRQDHFAQHGCKLSDHGIDVFTFMTCTEMEANIIFERVRSGKELSADEILKFKSAMLYELGIMNHEKGWVQQFHIGALRNNNTRLFNKIGPDTGFDSINDTNFASALSAYLNKLDSEDKLAKTIIYNLNPKDNEMIAAIIGNFQDGSVAGKIQYGSGWWFLDQKEGMERQMNALSTQGLLSRFVGMVTDSRSFLSFPRHEYFRRILCNLLGNDVEKGLIPNDMTMLGQMVENICYHNAKEYFKF